MILARYYILFFALSASAMPGCGQEAPVGSTNSLVADNYVAETPPQTTPAPIAVSDIPQSTSVLPAPPPPPIRFASIVNTDPPAVPPKGLAAVGSALHDFGTVQQNTELRHDFVLTNEGDAPIRITGMQSSCSCTWAKSYDEFVGTVIKPNQKIDFPLFIHTGTLQDRANGKITITYKFQSNDSKLAGEQKFTLEVNGTILPDYRIEPQNIRLGDVIALESRTAKATFRIVPVQLQSLEILGIKPSSPLWTAKILSSDKDGYEVEVTFDGSTLAVSENFSGNLIIETNSKKVPRGMVSVDADYYAPVNISDTEILVPSSEEGRVQKTVRITSRVPLQIVKAEGSPNSLVHSVFDTEKKSTEHSVTFSIEPCREVEIQETFNLELLLFPSVGKSISITCPVSVIINEFHRPLCFGWSLPVDMFDDMSGC